MLPQPVGAWWQFIGIPKMHKCEPLQAMLVEACAQRRDIERAETWLVWFPDSIRTIAWEVFERIQLFPLKAVNDKVIQEVCSIEDYIFMICFFDFYFWQQTYLKEKLFYLSLSYDPILRRRCSARAFKRMKWAWRLKVFDDQKSKDEKESHQTFIKRLWWKADKMILRILSTNHQHINI